MIDDRMVHANERVERYELLGELATGGMATVYLGRQTGPFGFKRTVAIKSMHPHFAKDEDFRAMFLDEATLTARIRHPNVVPTLDIVCAETKVLLVMEYIDGVSLSFLERLIKKDSASFPPAVAVAIVCDTLHGLHAAHDLIDDNDGKALEVVHRDVSPQNIHVGVDGLTRVLDFGIAKATTRRYVTQAGEVKGKLAYMSSEQLTGGEVDRRTDIYAAGVVIWELLTGRRLFEGNNDGEIIRLVLEGKSEPPSFLSDVELPPAIDKVVMKALSLKKEERYDTAEQMAKELALAIPPAPRGDVTAFVRKHASSELDARSKRFREPTPTTGDLEPEAKALLTVLMEHATSTALSTSSRASVGPPPSSATATASMPVPPPQTSASSSSKIASRVLMIGAGVVGLALLTGGAFVIGSRSGARTGTPTEPPPPAVSTEPPPQVDSAPTPTTPPPSSLVAAASSVPQTPPPPKTIKIAAPKRTGTVSAKATPRKDCNPPFIVDAHGDRHYKPECVE